MSILSLGKIIVWEGITWYWVILPWGRYDMGNQNIPLTFSKLVCFFASAVSWNVSTGNLGFCWSPAPAAGDSTWRGERCQQETEAASYFSWTACLFQTYDSLFILLQKHYVRGLIFLVPRDPDLFFSKNHCCPSKRIPSSAILLSTFSHVSLWIHSC